MWKVMWLAASVVTVSACALTCQPTGPASLTQREADRIISTYLESRNTANLELLDLVFDPQVVVHDCGAPSDIHGLDSLKMFYQGSHTGFPDLRMTFDEVIVSGANLIVRWTITGTHTGPLRGLPPTGKAVRFSGLAIDRVANGKIIEEWVYFNPLELLQQLGFSLVSPTSGAGSL